MRAVYRDMLTLFEPLLEVEGRFATDDELRLVHGAEYLARVKGWVAEAAERGRPLEVAPGIVVSDASWEAASAAVGSVLRGSGVVLDGEVRNAFCAVRPPGAGAEADAPGGFGLLNSVAVAARELTVGRGVGRVAVLDWDARGESALGRIFESDERIAYAAVPPAAGVSPEAFHAAQATALASLAELEPDFLLLAVGFDFLSADPVTDHALEPADFHAAISSVREWAEARCEGRIVAVLEGGFDAAEIGAAAVQLLRGLADLPPAD